VGHQEKHFISNVICLIVDDFLKDNWPCTLEGCFGTVKRTEEFHWNERCGSTFKIPVLL